ncbi:hypothetical protein ViNHUV68_13700 [Vibrio sp. NH-UV-68]
MATYLNQASPLRLKLVDTFNVTKCKPLLAKEIFNIKSKVFA